MRRRGPQAPYVNEIRLGPLTGQAIGRLGGWLLSSGQALDLETGAGSDICSALKLRRGSPTISMTSLHRAAYRLCAMPMQPDSAARVRQSWALVLPRRKTVCRDFYQRLFARYPELRPLFKVEIAEQADLFVTMINTVISALEHPQRVRPLIETLGARHADYGVHSEDYAKFEEVLLETLSDTLEDELDAEGLAAWRQVFEELSETMQRGAAR